MLFKIAGFIRVLFLLLAASALVQACTQDNGSGSGRVSILLTDDPTTDFDQVNITLDSIQLTGEGPDVFLSNQATTFNLLDLRNFSAMLAVNDQVPVATYSKLRLEVSNVELVKLNSDGSVAESIVAELPSGHIDLNPQEQITVAPGSDLVMQLDINAEKSLQVVATGSGKYIFRPQVFVEVLRDASSSLIQFPGTALDVNADSFELCKQGATTVNEDCRQVHAGINTVVMNADIDVINYSELQSGDPVLVFGRLANDTRTVDALRVFDGTSELPSYRGVFSAAVAADAADIVISQNAAGVSTGDNLTVTPVSPAGVFDNQGNALNGDAIAAGVSAQVIGVLKPDAITATEIKPGLVFVELP